MLKLKKRLDKQKIKIKVKIKNLSKKLKTTKKFIILEKTKKSMLMMSLIADYSKNTVMLEMTNSIDSKIIKIKIKTLGIKINNK